MYPQRTRWDSTSKGRRILIALTVVGVMAVVASPSVRATADSVNAGVTGYVITVDPNASPSDIADLVAAIEASPESELLTDAPRDSDRARTRVDVVFEEKLADGTVGTFGISADAIREEGLDAFDLSTMVEDMLAIDDDIATAGASQVRSEFDLLDPTTVQFEAAKHASAVENERAALKELYVTLQGTLSTPERLIVTSDGDAGTEALERLVEQEVGFSMAPVLSASPGEEMISGGSVASSDPCVYFSAKSGNTSLGYSTSYAGKRYTQTYSTWSQARVDHIASSCSVNSTYEIETHSTVAGGHFLGDYYKWYSSLPGAYKDTAFGDGGNTVEGSATKQWAIGTAQLDDVDADTSYRTTMWTDPGTASYDWFMSNGQLGIHPPGCTSTWCIVGVDSYYLAKPWNGTPGTTYWDKSDSDI